MSVTNNPWNDFSVHVRLLVSILSITVAVDWVTRVGLFISGKSNTNREGLQILQFVGGHHNSKYLYCNRPSYNKVCLLFSQHQENYSALRRKPSNQYSVVYKILLQVCFLTYQSHPCQFLHIEIHIIHRSATYHPDIWNLIFNIWMRKICQHTSITLPAHTL